MIRKYKNLGGNSGVTGYDYRSNWILVVFRGGAQYKYTIEGISIGVIDLMKELADKGVGLNSFISKNKRILKYSWTNYVRKR